MITTTYENPDFHPLQGIADVVLGYDSTLDSYVGIDPRRLEHGGESQNASTFVDRKLVENSTEQEIEIGPYASRLFSDGEFIAYFKPSRLAEYIFNQKAIHANLYYGTGPFSGPLVTTTSIISLSAESLGEDESTLVFSHALNPLRAIEVDPRDIDEYESDGISGISKKSLSPESLQAILRFCDENGRLGEEFVLRYERRRLRDINRGDLAERVDHISKRSVSAGYDIASFEENDDERFIEVKSSSGTGRCFQISTNEWSVASRLRAKYWIYRVTRVRDDKPLLEIINDPVTLADDGKLEAIADGYRITLS